MKTRPKATYHHGTRHQCGGEGDVLAIPGNPFDLSLSGAVGVGGVLLIRWHR